MLLLFFVSPLPISKMFPFEDFFHPGKQKTIVFWGDIGWIGRVGHRGHAIFGQKLMNTQHGVGRCTCTHHEMDKWVERVFKNNSLKPNSASHNNTSWYTDTDRFLECSPSGESLYYKGPTLQKIIPFLWGSPSYNRGLVVFIPWLFVLFNSILSACCFSSIIRKLFWTTVRKLNGGSV